MKVRPLYHGSMVAQGACWSIKLCSALGILLSWSLALWWAPVSQFLKPPFYCCCMPSHVDQMAQYLQCLSLGNWRSLKDTHIKALLSSIRTIGIVLPLASTVMCNGSLWRFPFFVKSLSKWEIVSSLLIDPIISFKSWEVVVVGTWIWLRRFTKLWLCLYEAMCKPHKDILACVFCNCLRTLSSSLGVC